VRDLGLWLLLRACAGGGQASSLVTLVRVKSRHSPGQEENTFLRQRVDAYELRISERQSLHTRPSKHIVFELGANDGAW
jgi:hypothetical protein